MRAFPIVIGPGKTTEGTVVIKTKVGITDGMRNSDGDDCNTKSDVGELLQQLKTCLLDCCTCVDGIIDKENGSLIAKFLETRGNVVGQMDLANSNGLLPFASPFIHTTFDDTQHITEPYMHTTQHAMCQAIALLFSTWTRQAHFAVIGFGKVISHPTGNFGSTMLNADDERRRETSCLDAAGELATSLSQKGRSKSYNGHGCGGVKRS